MENIELRDVKEGYEQCKDLSDLVTREGESLIASMGDNIKKLKVHWVGSDATKHINNLIIVHDALEAIVEDAHNVIKTAASSIVAVQEVIKANGGDGEVGSQISKTISHDAIANADETTQYHVDPAAAGDYTELEKECESFKKFVSNFKGKKDELLSNWTAGAGHEHAVSSFNGFEADSDKYQKYMLDAKENLATAVSNIGKLG